MCSEKYITPSVLMNSENSLYGYYGPGKFIDIGTVKRYKTASKILPIIQNK